MIFSLTECQNGRTGQSKNEDVWKLPEKMFELGCERLSETSICATWLKQILSPNIGRISPRQVNK